METKKCPFCAELIASSAIKCKHCRTMLHKQCPCCSEMIAPEAIKCKHCHSMIAEQKQSSTTEYRPLSRNTWEKRRSITIFASKLLLVLCIVLTALSYSITEENETGLTVARLILLCTYITGIYVGWNIARHFHKIRFLILAPLVLTPIWITTLAIDTLIAGLMLHVILAIIFTIGYFMWMYSSANKISVVAMLIGSNILSVAIAVMSIFTSIDSESLVVLIYSILIIVWQVFFIQYFKSAQEYAVKDETQQPIRPFVITIVAIIFAMSIIGHIQINNERQRQSESLFEMVEQINDDPLF